MCDFTVQLLSVSLMCPISLWKMLVAVAFAGNTHTHIHTNTRPRIADNFRLFTKWC